MAQTQYLTNSRVAEAAAVAGKPASIAQLASYLFFTVSFGFTAAVVVGLVH
ncbi:hypothetical protein QEZ47_25725 [Aminobacter anthyllidis]|uniref:hypothetical protein n=1 Tax=Aminobacter anthyllidis TaxID=1035067 RepID=UPI002453D14A|nr:hypothetical protein [Aminobacter anthyllidis]MDH4988850.1 hypothetical protein [Aminobacter anthyllidis]